ncbi:MAG: VRR-NUC domain-containing protein [Acidobacteriota bacterium]
MEPAPQRPLPEGYYVANFITLLDQVEQRYGDLLTAEEHSLRERFLGLSEGAQRLYVRLASRRGPVFRRDRLAYPEIPRLDAALEDLEAAHLGDRGDPDDFAPRIGLLLKAELTDLARQLLPHQRVSGESKADLRQRLLDEASPASLSLVLGDFEVVRPLDLELVDLYQLLFFGNFGQNLTEFVLRDLGVVTFESYSLDPDLRRFPDRVALDDTLELHTIRQHLAELLEAGDVDAVEAVGRSVLARCDPWHQLCQRPLDSLLLAAGRALERASRCHAALALFEPVKRPPGRERRARLHHRLGRDDEALALCTAMTAEPRDETEIAFADRFAHLVLRRQGKAEPRPRPRRCSQDLALPCGEPDDGAIEERVLAHFANHGRQGFFAENWLWRSLYGLAFWDIVFAPVAGAFEHPFQYGPLDLTRPDFRPPREGLIEARLDHLRHHREIGSLSRELLATYERKRGLANRLVPWNEELKSALELALGRLHGPQLAAVCDRLSGGLRRYGRGLPDLFVTAADPDDLGFTLYEVKGPGDTLRPEQGRWIDFLNRNRLPTKLLRVTWRSDAACYDRVDGESPSPPP